METLQSVLLPSIIIPCPGGVVLPTLVIFHSPRIHPRISNGALLKQEKEKLERAVVSRVWKLDTRNTTLKDKSLVWTTVLYFPSFFLSFFYFSFHSFCLSFFFYFIQIFSFYCIGKSIVKTCVCFARYTIFSYFFSTTLKQIRNLHVWSSRVCVDRSLSKENLCVRVDIPILCEIGFFFDICLREYEFFLDLFGKVYF